MLRQERGITHLDQQLELEVVPFGISGSKWVAISSRIRSGVRLWKIAGNWPQGGSSIYAQTP